MDFKHIRIAVFGNVHQTQKSRHVASVLRKLEELHVQILVEERFARFINAELHLNLDSYVTFRRSKPLDADVAISIGGDGTFLGTASIVGSSGVPILGINTGRLGFLADVSPSQINLALESVCKGEYMIEERTVMAVEKDGQLSSLLPYALNEVAVLKHDNSSLIEIETYVDNHFLAKFLADGLIVCTPTGSTGYSLSVGGPVLAHESGTFCLSPIAPHSLSVRPVVLRDNVVVRLHVKSRTHKFLLSADGRSESLREDTVITVRRAPYRIKVIKIEHQHFFDTLREKMMWGADLRD